MKRIGAVGLVSILLLSALFLWARNIAPEGIPPFVSIQLSQTWTRSTS